MENQNIKSRLEEIRIEIRAERISQGEIHELQSLAEHIDKNDVELLEWAGVDEFEEDDIEYTLGDDTINGVAINEKIRQEELFEYQIIHRENFLANELIVWIGECQRINDKQMMLDDLKYLFTLEDEYIFSSVSTNKYVCKSDDEFNEICEELLELNNSLK
jgi:hypothetical protein